MVGLRTKESCVFEKYFAFVQRKAEEDASVFFLESGDGNDNFFEDMEVCDLWGWLIPNDKVSEFEEIWLADKVDDEWVDYYKSAEWTIDNNQLNIQFNDY